MMSSRNQHWYNRNESRSYPLDDNATAITDDGKYLPSDILCDLEIKFPDSFGQYAFLGALSVTPGLVSLAIFATNEHINPATCLYTPLAPGNTAEPIAVLTVQKPIVKYQQYELTPLQLGVGGWAVFGDFTQRNENFTGRFSTPEQSILVPKAAKRYRSFLFESIGKLNSQIALSGLVLLRAGNDTEIYANRDVERDGFKYQEIVFSLVNATDRNVFEEYSGPCNGRPESLNCTGGDPIEFIGSVGPDCNGNITIEFTGCADVAQIINSDVCGAVLNCGIGMIDVCVTGGLPTASGKLPNATTSDCEVIITDVSLSLGSISASTSVSI